MRSTETESFVSYGYGFHSNDALVRTKDGEVVPEDRVRPGFVGFTGSVGAEARFGAAVCRRCRRNRTE